MKCSRPDWDRVKPDPENYVPCDDRIEFDVMLEAGFNPCELCPWYV